MVPTPSVPTTAAPTFAMQPTAASPSILPMSLGESVIPAYGNPAAGAGRGFMNPATVIPDAPMVAATANMMPSVNPEIGGDVGMFGFGGLTQQQAMLAEQEFGLPGTALSSGGATSGSWWDKMIGSKDNPGWGGFALGAANSAASMLFGMKQYGLAKQTLAENKRQFQMNYDAQKQTTNTALEDRQRARVASNAGAYESVGSYMDKNGVK